MQAVEHDELAARNGDTRSVTSRTSRRSCRSTSPVAGSTHETAATIGSPRRAPASVAEMTASRPGDCGDVDARRADLGRAALVAGCRVDPNEVETATRDPERVAGPCHPLGRAQLVRLLAA